MKLRVVNAADNFLVAYDPEAGKIAGFLNGVATNEAVFRDEFFTDITLHDPAGKNVMLLGLDVRPEYRGHSLWDCVCGSYMGSIRRTICSRRSTVL